MTRTGDIGCFDKNPDGISIDQDDPDRDWEKETCLAQEHSTVRSPEQYMVEPRCELLWWRLNQPKLGWYQTLLLFSETAVSSVEAGAAGGGWEIEPLIDFWWHTRRQSFSFLQHGKSVTTSSLLIGTLSTTTFLSVECAVKLCWLNFLKLCVLTWCTRLCCRWWTKHSSSQAEVLPTLLGMRWGGQAAGKQACPGEETNQPITRWPMAPTGSSCSSPLLLLLLLNSALLFTVLDSTLYSWKKCSLTDCTGPGHW